MSFWIDVAASGVAAGTPLVVAGLGELVCERSGVMNLGVEGMMLVGAATGFVAAYFSGNVWVGLLVSMAAGAVLSLLFALMTILLRTNQVVMGITLSILGAGLSAYIGYTVAGKPPPQSLGPYAIPLLSSIPWVGDIFFRHDVIVYLGFVMALVIWLFLFRTRRGLWLRSVGENPYAADAAGIPVKTIRYLAVAFGGAAAGLAGGYMSLAYTRIWAEGLTAGRGWIALALVIFATWRPGLVLLGGLLFGVVDSLGLQLQTRGVDISPYLLGMMPYIFTLVILALSYLRKQRRAGMPAALGVPYERESRTSRTT
jgi:general nucleoside transport system permease protein